MDAEPTVNSILDFFVPCCCRNDWQRWGPLLLTDNDGRTTLWLGVNGDQYAFRFDRWEPVNAADAEFARCTVQCEETTNDEILRVNDRANLTWVFARLSEFNTPDCPSYATRFLSGTHNAAMYDYEWEARHRGPQNAVILELPPLPPQLLLFLAE
jgi:hypothetical protein